MIENLCDPCGHDDYAENSLSILLYPQDAERFVVVLDSGGLFFELHTGLTLAESIVYMFVNPAVFFRLPAGAHGVLRASVKKRPDNSPPKFLFDFEIFHSFDLAELVIDDFDHIFGDAKDKLREFTNSKKLPSLRTEERNAFGTQYGFECPPDSGQLAIIECEAGKHGSCEEDGAGGHIPECVADNP